MLGASKQKLFNLAGLDADLIVAKSMAQHWIVGAFEKTP
jgi:hypothetical protein